MRPPRRIHYFVVGNVWRYGQPRMDRGSLRESTVQWGRRPFTSKEGGFSAYEDVIPKCYNSLGEYYAQTDTAENVTMTSPTYSLTTLPSGGSLSLTYTTTDTNNLILTFHNNQNVVGTYALGSTPGTHIYTMTLGNDLAFTSWTISGTFSAASYVEVTALTASSTLMPFPNTISVSPATIDQTQNASLTSIVSGGVPPYTYV